MLPSSRFWLHSIQAAVFAADGEFSTRQALVVALRESGETYDNEPVSFPSPPDLPTEIPSLILSSKDRRRRLHVARARLDAYWERQDEADQLDLADMLSALGDHLMMIAKHDTIQIGRLAAVVVRRAHVEHPGMLLSRQFCQPRWISEPGAPLNRPEGFELHAHKVFRLLPDLDVNSWIRIRTDALADHTYSEVSVQQDINTLASERARRDFREPAAAAFFEEASREFDIILRRYFPSDTLNHEGSAPLP